MWNVAAFSTCAGTLDGYVPLACPGLPCLALRRRSKRRPHDAANIVVIHLSLVWRGPSTVLLAGHFIHLIHSPERHPRIVGQRRAGRMTHRVNSWASFRTSVHVPFPALTETALMGFVQPTRDLFPTP